MTPLLLPVMLLAFQLSPALTPTKAPKPALPKIDQNACPFEGCQFGKWIVHEPVEIYDTWKSGRKLLRTLGKGEEVTAVTGIHITFQPAEIQVTAPIREYGLKPGDRVFGYMSIGEGFFNAWSNGFWVEEFDGSGIQTSDGSGCRLNCNAKLLKTARSKWWVMIKMKNGIIGWTKDGNKFEGTDALAEVTCPPGVDNPSRSRTPNPAGQCLASNSMGS
jgi:hypothetical protein